jgi:bacillithiol system protein YtxJ
LILLEQVADEAQLESIFTAKLAVLLKHSPVCAGSAVALEEMQNFAAGNPDVPVYMVDVRTQRPLSNKTAAYFGIEHESPQVIMVQGGAAVWHASHYEITAARVSQALSSL